MTDLIQQITASSRSRLLEAIAEATDLTFIRLPGNIGDELILAGTRQLLSKARYREIPVAWIEKMRGHTALIAGGGAWCKEFHFAPDYLRVVEKRFERVIVLPSSFDISVDCVREALASTNALVFARELRSYAQIRDLCRAELAHDCALYFDYRPYVRSGEGSLLAFRTDAEASSSRTPPGNNDISRTCETLDEWLWTIARHDLVRTDRAHVTIAAALLGKQVEYRPSNYHKVNAIVDYSLGQLPVRPLSDHDYRDLFGCADDRSVIAKPKEPASLHQCGFNELLKRMAQEITAVIPPETAFLVVGEELLECLPVVDRVIVPFLERDGQYWGAPADDATAIAELVRLRARSPSFLVLPCFAFWWRECYPEFTRYLRENFHCVLENEWLVVFDLRA